MIQLMFGGVTGAGLPFGEDRCDGFQCDQAIKPLVDSLGTDGKLIRNLLLRNGFRRGKEKSMDGSERGRVAKKFGDASPTGCLSGLLVQGWRLSSA